MQTLPIDPRLVVVGTSAVGKTTFARALATALQVPFVELDELHWSPVGARNLGRSFLVSLLRLLQGACGWPMVTTVQFGIFCGRARIWWFG
jgi:ATP-dependent protease Clp ATPase subunit